MTIYYYDISKKGRDLLGTKDIPMLTNEQTVKESIMNLFQTQPFTVPMNPEIGLDLDRYLFDPIDDLSAAMMKIDIEMGLKRYEPRINNIQVQVIGDEDLQTYIIYLNFEINFTNSNQEMVIDFKSIR